MKRLNARFLLSPFNMRNFFSVLATLLQVKTQPTTSRGQELLKHLTPHKHNWSNMKQNNTRMESSRNHRGGAEIYFPGKIFALDEFVVKTSIWQSDVPKVFKKQFLLLMDINFHPPTLPIFSYVYFNFIICLMLL